MSQQDREELAIDGGPPVRTQVWPTYEHGTGEPGEAAVSAVAEILKSGRLFRYDTRDLAGTAAGQYEQALRRTFGSRHALAVSSGTAAIALAFMGADLPPGSLVGCPVFGFPATASAILLAGHIPVLVAVDDDLHLDFEDARKRVGDELRALVVVHMRGFASDVGAAMRWAAERDLFVVEDAVPALGARYGGRLLGTFGHVGCFSTQSDKTINTGEGGFLVTDDPAVYERALLMSGVFEGRHRKHEVTLADADIEFRFPVYNFRIDELRAGLAHAELNALDERVRTLKDNYDHLAVRLAELPGVRLRAPVAPDAYLGDSLVFFVDPELADWVAAAITAEGVQARCFGSATDVNVRAFWHWTFIDAHLQRDAEHFATSVTALRSAVDISLSPRLTPADLDHVVEAVAKVMRAAVSSGRLAPMIK